MAWLPISRKDENMDMVLRIYVPDLEKMKTWNAPKMEKLPYLGITPPAGNSL